MSWVPYESDEMTCATSVRTSSGNSAGRHWIKLGLGLDSALVQDITLLLDKESVAGKLCLCGRIADDCVFQPFQLWDGERNDHDNTAEFEYRM